MDNRHREQTPRAFQTQHRCSSPGAKDPAAGIEVPEVPDYLTDDEEYRVNVGGWVLCGGDLNPGGGGICDQSFVRYKEPIGV